MLHQELPSFDSTPLAEWELWLVPALAVAAGLTAALILLLLRQAIPAGLAFVAGLGVAALVSRRPAPIRAIEQPLVAGPDYSLVGSALGLSEDPVALTDGEGTLLVVNGAYRERLGNTPPPRLAS